MNDPAFSCEHCVSPQEVSSVPPGVDIGKFMVVDNGDGMITIFPTNEEEPLCLTHKEALALVAMIMEQIQSSS